MSLLARSRPRFALVISLFTLLAPGRIFAVSCTTQAQMAEADRGTLVKAATTLASAVQSANVAAVQALTIPKVKAQFDSIASTIEQTAPLLAGATVTIDALYGLDASDLKSSAEDTQFFCGIPGSRCMWTSPYRSFPRVDMHWLWCTRRGCVSPSRWPSCCRKTETGRWPASL
jgi:hypothetical protein